MAGLIGVDPQATQPGTGQGGTLTGGSTALSYARAGARWSTNVAGRANVNHSPTIGDSTTAGYAARGIATGQLGRSTQVRLGGRIEYSPRYGLGTRLFESSDLNGIPILNNGVQDVDPLALTALYHFTQATVSQDLTRRSSVNISYQLQQTDFSSHPADQTVQTGQAYYRYDFAQGTSLSLGYGYIESSYERFGAADTTYGFHEIIANLNHSRAFSLTRATTFSFGVGSALAQPAVDRASGASRSRMRLLATGTALLDHQIGRSWSIGISYARALQFLDGFTEPQLTDTVMATLGGLVSRGIDVSASVGYGRGSPASGAAGTFDTYQAVAQIRFALNRHASFFSQYFFNRYGSSRGDVNPLFGLRQDYGRHGARVGLDLWAPLLRR